MARRKPVSTSHCFVVTGWTDYGDDTTDGFVYFSQEEAKVAAQENQPEDS